MPFDPSPAEPPKPHLTLGGLDNTTILSIHCTPDLSYLRIPLVSSRTSPAPPPLSHNSLSAASTLASAPLSFASRPSLSALPAAASWSSCCCFALAMASYWPLCLSLVDSASVLAFSSALSDCGFVFPRVDWSAGWLGQGGETSLRRVGGASGDGASKAGSSF